MATRSLVTDHKPSETPSASSYDHQDAAQHPGILKRRVTHNYEKALASTQTSDDHEHQQESNSPRPNLDRSQSFNMNDYKRELMQQTLPNAGSVEGHGYHSTAAAQ